MGDSTLSSYLKEKEMSKTDKAGRSSVVKSGKPSLGGGGRTAPKHVTKSRSGLSRQPSSHRSSTLTTGQSALGRASRGTGIGSGFYTGRQTVRMAEAHRSPLRSVDPDIRRQANDYVLADLGGVLFMAIIFVIAIAIAFLFFFPH